MSKYDSMQSPLLCCHPRSINVPDSPPLNFSYVEPGFLIYIRPNGEKEGTRGDKCQATRVVFVFL
jgi:hypothetical protein